MATGLKPAQAADREAELRAAEADALGRAWWGRVPQLVTSPKGVFEALRDTDELDVGARSEPVLAITILAGIAGVLLAPAWGTVMDDGSVDGLVLLVATFVAGLLYGAAGYFLLGFAVWLGAKAVGVETRFRVARQLVGFAALPMALSLAVVVPAIAIAFGDGLVPDRRLGRGYGRGRRRRGRARVRRLGARPRRGRVAHDVPAAVAGCRGRDRPCRRARRGSRGRTDALALDALPATLADGDVECLRAPRRTSRTCARSPGSGARARPPHTLRRHRGSSPRGRRTA